MKLWMNRAIWAVVLFALLAADQITKLMAAAKLKGQADYMLIQDIFSFSYHENTGAAFSSFLGKQGFLITLTLLVIALLVWKFITMPEGKRMTLLRISFLLVISGGVGNLIDRVRGGYVIDFLYFIPINFPKFNLADSYVTIGMVLLAIGCFFYYKEEEIDYLFRIRSKEDFL